jgi:hypothetical protein
MRATHAVEMLDVEFVFANEADAWALHERLGDFAARRAMDVIGEIFDEFDGPAQTIRIDRLELDLGATAGDERDLEARLRTSLRAQLEDLLRGAEPRGGRSAAADAIAPAEADFDLLWRLVRSGRLPWRFAFADADEIDALIERVLSTRGRDFAAALRSATDAAALMARIARQWPSERRIELLRLLSADVPHPAADDDGAAWEDALQRAAGRGPGGDDDAPDRRAFEAEIAAARLGPAAWRLIETGRPWALAVLRRLGGDAQGRARLAASLTPSARRRLLRAWAPGGDAEMVIALVELAPAEATDAESGSPLDDFLLSLVLPQLGRRPDPDAVVRAVAGRRAQSEPRANGTIARLLEGAPRALAARLRPVLAEAFEPDAAGAAAPAARRESAQAMRDARRREAEAAFATGGWPDRAWRALLEEDPSWLATVLRRYGVTAAWRRTMARQVSQDRLADLISLWLPARDAPILSAMVEADRAWGLAREAPPAAVVREWLLSALLLSEADRFDLADVVLELMRALARRKDMDEAAAAWSLARDWPRTEAWRAARGALFQAALRLEAQAGPEAPDPRGETLKRELFLDWAPAWGRAALELMDALSRVGTRAGLPAPTLSRLAWRLLVPNPGDATGFAPERVVSRWTDAAVEGAGRGDSDAARKVLEAAVRAEVAALAAGRAGHGVENGGETAEAADDLFTPGRSGALPDPPPAELSDRLKAALAPPDVGARRLARLSESQRRDLFVRLAGADGLKALTTLDALVLAWARAGLPPQADASERDWRLLLELLSGPAGPFRVAGFVARWSAAATGAMPPDARKAALRALEQALQALAAGRGETFSIPDGPLDRPWLEALARPLPPGARQALAEALAPAVAGLRRIGRLDEAARRELLARLAPRDGPRALAATDQLSRAWTAAGLPTPAGDDWRFLLTELFEQGRRFEAAGFAARWFAARVEAQAPPGGRGPARLALAQALEDVARRGDGLAATLAEALMREAPSWEAADGGAPSPAFPDGDPEEAETLYVANAGLVLLGPYIPLLFDRLQLTRGGGFVDEAARERGARLLQLLVDPGARALEPHLVLNKLLCGLDLATPVSRDFTPTPAETAVVESLLQAVIQAWGALGSTSIAGLRETFLQREGALTREETAWRLKVAPGPFDMLVDRLPWGFRTLKLPWMAQVVHVDWR